MALKLRTFKLFELEDFIHSKEYLALENVPISPQRALSYIHNPRAEKEDIVLYGLCQKNEWVAYRTILSDYLISKGEKIKFGWLSGNWVAPKYRRQGLSTQLFWNAYEDWNQKLLFTNYAPESEKAYLKTGAFTTLHTLNGYRYYLKANTAEILPHKHTVFKNQQNNLKKLDALLNQFSLSKEYALAQNAEILEFDAYDFFKDIDNQNFFFQKGSSDYQWWVKYPWILNEKSEENPYSAYYFSDINSTYQRKIIRISNSTQASILVLSLKNKVAKLPYYFIQEADLPDLIQSLGYLFNKEGITHFTCYDKNVNQKLSHSIFKKKFTQNFYVTNTLKDKLSAQEGLPIFSGDGDGIFT